MEKIFKQKTSQIVLSLVFGSMLTLVGPCIFLGDEGQLFGIFFLGGVGVLMVVKAMLHYDDYIQVTSNSLTIKDGRKTSEYLWDAIEGYYFYNRHTKHGTKVDLRIKVDGKYISYRISDLNDYKTLGQIIEKYLGPEIYDKRTVERKDTITFCIIMAILIAFIIYATFFML